MINDENGQPHQHGTNKAYVQNLMMTSLVVMFPNLNRVQVEAFVLKLFNTVYDWSQFKNTLRDLLISMKQFASANDAFYQEERDQQAALERERKQAIPGLIRNNAGFAQQAQLLQQ